MFQLNHVAEVGSISASKGKDEDTPLCVTVGLQFETVGNEPVAAALGCHEDDLAAFFGEPGDCRFSGIEEIASWAEYKDKHEISMLGFSHQVAKVSKIRIKPRSIGKYSMSLSIQLQDPPEHVIEKIAGALRSDRQVKLDQEAELPLERPGEEREAA